MAEAGASGDSAGRRVERRRLSPAEQLARWAAPAATALVALGTAWLLWSLGEEPATRGEADAHRPDAYMVDFERSATDEAGRLASRLRAGHMVHYADDQSTELVSPELEFYNDDESARADPRPWRAVSETGWMSGDGEVLILAGPVKLWRLLPGGGREVELDTLDLRVLPEVRYAETDAPVTISTPTTYTEAIGLRADLAIDQLELMHDVRSRYQDRTHRSGNPGPLGPGRAGGGAVQ